MTRRPSSSSVASALDPDPDWADQVADQAVRAGAKYVVLTAMHHDGYCLFKTETDSFNAVETGPGRDLVAVSCLIPRGLHHPPPDRQSRRGSALHGRAFDHADLTAEVLGLQPLDHELLLDLHRVGAREVTLGDCDDDRHG